MLLVSKDGKTVINTKNNKLRAQYHNSRGYMFISIRYESKQKNFLVHRLVAEAWIDNPNNHTVVNHLDHNKLNNHADNLEWTTQQNNLEHYNQSEKAKEDKIKLNQIKKDGTWIPAGNYKAQKKHIKANYVRFPLNLKPDVLEQFRTACIANGSTPTTEIKKAINAYIEQNTGK